MEVALKESVRELQRALERQDTGKHGMWVGVNMGIWVVVGCVCVCRGVGGCRVDACGCGCVGGGGGVGCEL
jgi:hypothetical protein